MNSLVSLGEIATVFNGKTPAKMEQKPEGFSVLKIRDVDEHGRFRGKCASFVDHQFAQKFRSKWLEPNDILILNAAHNADYVASKTFFAGAEVCGILPTGEWLIIRTNARGVLASYVNHWIQTDHTRSAIRFVVKGIHLYPKDVAKLQIRIPPLDEQRRIVGVLDRAAEILRRADAARAKARAIIPALFLETFGDPATNPKGWATQALANVADLGSGLTKGRKLNGTPTVSTPYLRVANVQADRLDLSEIKMIDATEDDRSRCRLECSDLLMTEGGDIDKLGRCAMWRGEVDLCLHQNHVFRVRMRKSVNPDFARIFMQSEAARSYFLRVAKRTTGIASINKTQLGQLSVWVPPLPLQTSFAEQVQRLEALARALEAAAAKAEAMASAMSAGVFDPMPHKGNGHAGAQAG